MLVPRKRALQSKILNGLFLRAISFLVLFWGACLVAPAEASSITLNYTAVNVDARQCLPPKTASRPETPAFLSKVFDRMKTTCDSKNWSEEDRLEYLTAIVGVSAPNPATPLFAVYGGGKFTGFMKDCIAQAFLDSSVASYREEDRQVLKDAIGGINTAKGWSDYVKGLPEMSTQDRIEDLYGRLKEATKQANEGPSDLSISDYLSSSYKTGERAIRLIGKGQMRTLVDDSDFALEECRFDDAITAIEQAEGFAKKNCQEFGWQLRTREKAFLSYIKRHHRTLKNKKSASMASKLYNLDSSIKRTKHSLDYYIGDEIYGSSKSDTGYLGRIDSKKKEAKDRMRGFEKQQSKFRVQQEKVVDALRDGSANCQTIASLEKRFHHYSAQCKREFFKGKGVRLWQFDELYDRLEQNGRKHITLWWDQVDNIRRLFHGCKSTEAERIKNALAAKISEQPVFFYSAGQCGSKKLTDLRDQLSRLTERAHCRKRKVPNVVGSPVDKATDAIYEARLVPGKILTLENKDGKWTENLVVKTDPNGGSVVAPQSTVDIYKAGKIVEQVDKPIEMVKVPSVQGKAFADAAALVNANGLIPSINREEPADEYEKQPDLVFSSDPNSGETVPRGTTVILNAYGKRPVVEVPDIAGLDFKAATALLAAQKLYTTDKPCPWCHRTGGSKTWDDLCQFTTSKYSARDFHLCTATNLCSGAAIGSKAGAVNRRPGKRDDCWKRWFLQGW